MSDKIPKCVGGKGFLGFRGQGGLRGFPVLTMGKTKKTLTIALGCAYL